MHINSSQFFQADATVNTSGKQPPSIATRTFLQNSDDLANQPFGKLVSLFARGEVPASTDTTSAGSIISNPDVTSDTTNTVDSPS